MPTLTIRHVTTYRYRQPVAFGEHRMMLRPRDASDQRVLEASIAISPEPKSLRFVQDAFGNHLGIVRFSGRSEELSFESTVCVEHSPSNVADLEIEDYARSFPFDYSADEMPDLAPFIERHQPDPGNEVGRWALSIPAPGRVYGHFRASQRPYTGHQSWLPLPAAGSKGNPRAVGDAPTRLRQLPRLRHAHGRGSALARSRGAVCIWVSRCPARLSRGACEWGPWLDPCRAQIYLPSVGWIDFDPTSGKAGKSELVTVAVVRDPRDAIPLHGTFIGFPSDHLGMEVEVSITSGTPEAIWATP